MASHTRKTTENPVERYLLTRCRSAGFLCLKFTSPARRGVPDRVVITRAAGIVFVEVKRPGGTVRANQLAMHTKIRRHGGTVYVVDSKPSVDAFIRSITDMADRTDPHAA